MRTPCIDWHAAFETLAFDHYRPYLYQAGYDLIRVYTEDDRIVFLAVTADDGIDIDTCTRIADHLAEGITAATRGLLVYLGISHNGSAARMAWFHSPSDAVPLRKNLPPIATPDAVTPAHPRSAPPTPTPAEGSPALAASPEAKAEEDGEAQ